LPKNDFLFVNIAPIDDWNRKGHQDLIPAFLNEFYDEENVKLVMLDPATYENDLPKNIEKQMNDEKILHLDYEYLSQPEVARLLKSCDALLHCNREGQDYTILEAMAVGLPVICTQDGANSIFAKPENSFGVKTQRVARWSGKSEPLKIEDNWILEIDQDSIRKQIRYLYENIDEPEVNEKIENGMTEASSRSFELVAQKLLEAVKQIQEVENSAGIHGIPNNRAL